MNGPESTAGKPSWALKGVSGLAILAAVAFPFLAFAGQTPASPRPFLAAVISLFLLRALLARSRGGFSGWKEGSVWALPAAVLLLAFLSGSRSLALYWPAAVSAALLFTFGRTLVWPPSMVERFARLQKPALSDAEVGYCRRVTVIWCAFFVANGGVALFLARPRTIHAWRLYTGVLSYLLMGILFGSEYLYRHWRFRPEGALLSGWFDRWGPPPPLPARSS